MRVTSDIKIETLMIQDDVQEIIQPVIEDLGYKLWGCEYLPQGKHSLLRIYIDREEGIGIEDCEKVSKQISSTLDVEDPIAGHYQLEISSPGIPRPLFYAWQYKEYIGEMADLKLYQPIEKTRKISGIIKQADEEFVVVCINEDDMTIPFNNIVKAYLTNN